MRYLINIVILCCWSFSYSQPFFYGEVDHIVQKHCARCHGENGPAPFPLETYKDVSKRAQFVQFVTEQRIMPPWKANPHYRTFVGENYLSKKELETIREWVAAGAPKGKKKNRTSSSNFTQWDIAADLTLSMKNPVPIPGTNSHHFICYAIPYELDQDTFVKSIQFIPGNRQLVHHCSYQLLAVHPDVSFENMPEYFVFSEDSINAIDDDHDYSFFDLLGPQGQKPKEVFHNGWLPGASPLKYPEGIGFYMPKKGVLLIRNLHYSPSPIPTQDLSQFRFRFAEKPIDRVVLFAAFKPTGIDYSKEHVIRANTRDTFEMNIKLHQDVSLLNVNPHMHELGSYFIAYAISPSKDTIPLIEIPAWDFNWQEFYQFKNPIKIPAGSVLYAKGTYNNTTSNLSNPFDPPQDVYFERGGMEETEEMLRLTFLYLPYRPGDESIILNPAHHGSNH